MIDRPPGPNPFFASVSMTTCHVGLLIREEMRLAVSEFEKQRSIMRTLAGMAQIGMAVLKSSSLVPPGPGLGIRTARTMPAGAEL